MIRSCDLEQVADGATVEVAGMVVARQRPETAKGITFMLIEDERGTVNLIVGRAVYEDSRIVVRDDSLVRARGRLERREGAVNVIVANLGALENKHAAQTSGTAAESAKPARPRSQQRIREMAIAELRAVAPTGHSFGRRGR